ncbi:MAG: efflux RND transporter periplasmic adaptor subunit [Parvibaculaceae bacterium]
MNDIAPKRTFKLTLPAAIRKLPRQRQWMLAGGIAAIVIVGAGYFYFSDSSSVTYRTATVTRGDVEQTVTALGALQPKEYVDVGAQVSGTLEAVHVNIGDLVTKGQLLAEVDPTLYEATVASDKAKLRDLEAQIKGQEAQLALAVIQNKRNQGLLKIDAVSKDVADTSAAQVKQLSATIESSKAQLDQAQSALTSDEANLGYTKIYAPMAGTVTTQTTLQGQTLNNKQSAPTILQIADLTLMTVKAQVAEADVSKLKPGMPVYFTTLGMPDRKWHATVRQILPTPETINDVILYDALIDVTNTDQALMTSMTAQVFFVLGEVKDVVIIPVAALKPARSGEEGAYRVQVMNGSKPKMMPVKIGLQNRVSAEVLSGLKEGDVVVTGVTTSGATQTRGGGNSSGGLGGGRGARL